MRTEQLAAPAAQESSTTSRSIIDAHDALHPATADRALRTRAIAPRALLAHALVTAWGQQMRLRCTEADGARVVARSALHTSEAAEELLLLLPSE